MKNIAIILAAGVGSRLGWNKPKQFFKIAGKQIVEHTIDCFEKNKFIDEIAIVVGQNFIHDYESMLLRNKWHKVRKILIGGKERYDSSLSAIKAYEHEGEEVNLIFHDAVRPLVSQRIINDVCEALLKYKAIDVTVPPIDTIVKIDRVDNIITEIPNREFLRRGQTPQAFRLSLIKDAYEKALNDADFKATDDCGIVKRYLSEVPVFSVEGEERNVKLTHPEDIYLLDKLFQIKTTSCSKANKKDLRDKVVIIFGGNSGIGSDIAKIVNDNLGKVYIYSRSNGVDVSKIEDVSRALLEVYKNEGKIDFIVNTAAILNKNPLTSLTNDEVKNLINVNYLGAVNTTLAGYEYLKDTKGKILQFTSSSYTRGRAFYALYSSSKAAVVNFVQAVAEEWSDEGIAINCINPQRTKTPMRVKNFGNEPENSLLNSKVVAEKSIDTLLTDITGEVVDIKINDIK